MVNSPPPIPRGEVLLLFRQFSLSQLWQHSHVMHFLLPRGVRWCQIRRRHLLPAHSPHSLRRLRLRQPRGHRQDGREGQGPKAASSPHWRQRRRSHLGGCRGNTESVAADAVAAFSASGVTATFKFAAAAADADAMILPVGGTDAPPPPPLRRFHIQPTHQPLPSPD